MEESLLFPELRLLEFNFSQQWDNALGSRHGSVYAVKANTLCKLADMLRAIKHGEIARSFSRILAPLIHGETDEALLSR